MITAIVQQYMYEKKLLSSRSEGKEQQCGPQGTCWHAVRKALEA